jgi:hypothetical protein
MANVTNRLAWSDEHRQAHPRLAESGNATCRAEGPVRIPNVGFGESRADLGLLILAASAAAFVSAILPQLITEDLISPQARFSLNS